MNCWSFLRRARARFATSALALSAGAALLASHSALAANTGDTVKTGATDLGNNSTTTYNTVAGTTSDVQFLAATAYTSPLALSTALSIGTLDDLNQTAITINGTALLTLNTASNSTAGSNSADLLFVASGANLTVNDTAGITFAVSGNIDSAGTLSLGTSPLNFGTTTQTFTGAGNTTVGGAIAASAGLLTVNKAGGTLTLSGLNLYTGATTVNAGTLNLNFSANAAPTTATNIIKSGNTINLGGGALVVTGGGASATNTQTFGTTALTANTASTITANLNGGTALNLALGGITRNAQSTLDITLGGADVTTTGTTFATNGVLTSAASNGVAFATVNGGAAFASNTAGTIGALAPVPGTYGATANVSVGTADAPASGAGANTLTFSGASDTVTLTGTNAITTGGILAASSATGASTITGGTLRAGSGREFAIFNYEPTAFGALTISSTIADSASGSSALTVAGTGSTILSAANTYTGATNITGGTLNIVSGGSITTTGATNVTGGTLNIASGGSISTSNLVMSNGTNVNIAGNLTNSAAPGSSTQKIRGNVTQTAGTVNVNGLDLSDTAGDTASYYLGGTGSITAGKGTFDSLSVGARGVSTFYVSGNSSLNVTGSAESQTSNSDAFQLTVGSVFSGPTVGTSTFVQQGGTVTTNGLSLGGSQGAVTPGIYYLNGGTLTSGTLTRGSNASSSGTLSFGGGTFKNSAAISTDANLITKINSGGATIDTSNGNLTWSGAILAGNTGTVTGFTSLTGGSGSTPGQIPLTFSAPTSGTTATGVAIVDQSGVVTDIVITNPGSGYTSAPTITGLPGGASATATFNTTAGGLTKIGSNTLTLTGNDTYTGTTTVSGGILTAAATSTNEALGGTTSILVNNGGTLLFGTANQASAAAAVTLGTTVAQTPASTTGILSVTAGASQGTAATVTGGTTTVNGNGNFTIAGGTVTGSTTAGLGALTLSNTSTLTYAGAGTTLVFGTFTPNGNVLTITGYMNNGVLTAGNSGTAADDRLIFSGDQSGNFADFNFGAGPGVGVGEIALNGGFYEVTAVPEPSTWPAGFVCLGFVSYRMVRSRRQARRAARILA